jgi:predicted DCC family thiol-disulfide oxidoreductase YuxK
MNSITIWYDGGCPLCLREIALMRKLDWQKRIDFVDLMGAAAVCPLEKGIMLARLHALENGQILSGAAAFAAMWRVIPLLRPLGLIARNTLILRLLERLYLRFLVVRPIIQRYLKARI